jgi:adenylate cyclase
MPPSPEPRNQTNIPERRLFGLIEWLSGNECRDLDEAGLIRALVGRLCALPLPVDYVALYLRTLHPEIRARIIVWSPERPVEIYDRAHTALHIAAPAGSPVRQVMETREWRTVRADADGAAIDRLEVFRNHGLAELVIAPLPNGGGLTSAAAFGTRRTRGFATAERQALERILPALCGTCELRLLRHGGATLLDTYVGPTTGQRILAGQVRRGDVESLEAALLLCDLRDFTGLSNRLPADQVLERLNLYFDQVDRRSPPAAARSSNSSATPSWPFSIAMQDRRPAAPLPSQRRTASAPDLLTRQRTRILWAPASLSITARSATAISGPAGGSTSR